MSPVTLPWPPKECSTNYRPRWKGEKWKPYAQYRDDCAWIIRAHCRGLPGSWGNSHPTGRVRVEVAFILPDNRRRDTDNMLGSIKGALDSLSRETGINDSRFDFDITRWIEKGKKEVRIGMIFP